jgi:hypothetical protein
MLVAGCEGLLQRKADIPPSQLYKMESADAGILQFYRYRSAPDKLAEWSLRLRVIPGAGVAKHQ